MRRNNATFCCSVCTDVLPPLKKGLHGYLSGARELSSAPFTSLAVSWAREMTVLASVALSLHCSLSSGLTILSTVGFFQMQNSLCLYALCGINGRNPIEVSFHTRKEDRVSERAAATVFLRVQVIATCIISLFKALRLMLFLPILTCLTILFAFQSAAKNANC